MKSIFFSETFPSVKKGWNSTLQFCVNSTMVVWGVGDETNSFDFASEVETDEDHYIANIFLTTPKKMKAWAKKVHAEYLTEYLAE